MGRQWKVSGWQMLGEEDKALDPLMRVVASDDCGAPWVQVTDGGRLCELSRE